MSWLEITALAFLLLGVGAGGFLVAQRPAFWAGLGVVLFTKAWPYVSGYVSKRMTPEEEEAWRKATRQADGGDAFNRKRRGAPPKG